MVSGPMSATRGEADAVERVEREGCGGTGRDDAEIDGRCLRCGGRAERYVPISDDQDDDEPALEVEALEADNAALRMWIGELESLIGSGRLGALENLARLTFILVRHATPSAPHTLDERGQQALSALIAEHQRLEAIATLQRAPAAIERELLGRIVRSAWVDFAQRQPQPKPSHLLGWEALGEEDREVDRQIGERVAEHVRALRGSTARIHCDGSVCGGECRGHDATEFRDSPELADDAGALVEALCDRIAAAEEDKVRALDKHLCRTLAVADLVLERVWSGKYDRRDPGAPIVTLQRRVCGYETAREALETAARMLARGPTRLRPMETL
jgi:hypothetical protein